MALEPVLLGKHSARQGETTAVLSRAAEMRRWDI